MIFVYSLKEVVRKKDSSSCPDRVVTQRFPLDLSRSSLVVVLLILRNDFFCVAESILKNILFHERVAL